MKLPKKIAALLTVTLVAGSGVGNITTVDAAQGAASETLVGKGRWETAIEISKKGWSSAKEVVIVNDSALADALTATPFAESKNAPILLTQNNKLDERTKAELKRLGVQKVYLIGGTNALNKSVEDALKAEKLSVDRIWGNTRYETSLEIAKRLDSIKDVSEIAVVNGDKGLVDAISVAPVAADKDMPVILSHPSKGTQVSDAFIKGEDIKTSYIIGGTTAVSNEIGNKLPNAKRLDGKNRNETNAKVIETFYTEKELKNAYIAKDGMAKESELIDGLAVGVLAAKNDSPVVLVRNGLNQKQKDVTNTKSFKTITQVGGGSNKTGFNQLKSMQEVNTYNVKTVAEFKEALAKADANDVINFVPTSDINENIAIITNTNLTVNLSGEYLNTVTVSAPNATIVNKGNITTLVVKDTIGGKVENASGATISKIEIQGTSSKVELINKGTVTNIKNDASGTIISNSGTITNNPTGSQSPSLDGNRPGGSTGGGSGSGSVTPSTKYNVTFKVDNDIVISKEVNKNDKVEAPEAPVKEGYTFKGWALSTNPETIVDLSKYIVTENVEFVAVFEITQLQKATDAVAKAEKTRDYNDYMEAQKLVSELENSKEKEELQKRIANIVIVKKEEVGGENYISLQFPTQIKKFTITSDDKKLNFIMDMEKFELKIPGAETGEKDSNGFVTYTIGDKTIIAKVDYSKVIFKEVEGNGNITDITFKNELEKYDVVFKLDGKDYDSKSIAEYDKVEAPEAPVKEGYTFKGWALSTNPETIVDLSKYIVTENVEFVAVFEITQLQKATDAVAKAEKTRDYNDYMEAQKLVSELENSKEKEELQKRIANIVIVKKEEVGGENYISLQFPTQIKKFTITSDDKTLDFIMDMEKFKLKIPGAEAGEKDSNGFVTYTIGDKTIIAKVDYSKVTFKEVEGNGDITDITFKNELEGTLVKKSGENTEKLNFDEETYTFTGEIPYYLDFPKGPGNYIEVRITAPEGEIISDNSTIEIFNQSINLKSKLENDGRSFIYRQKIGPLNSDKTFKLNIKWNENCNDEISINIDKENTTLQGSPVN